jgi:hypothetical protein
MKRMILQYIWLFVLIVSMYFNMAGFCQSASQDTARKWVPSHPAVSDTVDGEIVLESIEIKGSVEKPGIIIMPKRVEPELGEVDLERSFQKEVKQGVGEIPKPEKELNAVEEVKSIKKTVDRKRK